ncbi:MAG: TonB-dependent receptor, partial [Candidatus Binatia bacterium]
RASVQVRWLDDQFEDDLNSLELGDFVVVDLHLSRPIFDGFELFFGAENLFDREIEAGRTADGIVTIGAPLLVHGGIRLTL